MFYEGRSNKVYQKYAQYRDWLYAIDDLVEAFTGVSLFNLPVVPTRHWYDTGANSYDVAMWVILEWIYS